MVATSEHALLTLISHPLCPYVQRAAIALLERGTPFTRRDIDLAAKPAWFLAVSPLGKTPVLLVDETPVFESAVILEYLEETQLGPLHPADPLARAEHRGWIEVASALLNDIAAFYAARDDAGFERARAAMAAKLARLEARLCSGPYFTGAAFSLVDAAFAPVFRYLDAFNRIAEFGLLDGKPRNAGWRAALAGRASVRAAVGADYPQALWRFLQARGSRLSGLMHGLEAPPLAA